jgi:hypothetical protein
MTNPHPGRCPKNICRGFYYLSSKITTSITLCCDDTSHYPDVSFGQITNERKNARLKMSDKQTYTEKQNQNPCYEIRLKAHLDRQWAGWFEGMTITLEEDGTALLAGPVADQAALHGLLKKVRDLGLLLVSVNRAQANEIHPPRLKKEKK